MKLDLGCGDNKKEGFTGIDFVKTEAADIVHNLFEFPWPIESDTVEEVHCSHFFEHIPNLVRGKWMDELCRVMKPGAKATIIVPYAFSRRSIQDYTHEWPPVCETSFLYFNKEWRANNKLTHGHYDIKCDFDFAYGWQINNGWAMRAEESRNFAIAHYNSVVDDLVVTLTKK
jgi:predicted SAM-dependent methyltransferase